MRLESPITANRANWLALARKYYIWLVMLMAAAIYLAALPTFQVGTYMDDALYITLAKSISSGQGLRRIELVGAPFTTFVPFGYPLLLAPLVYLFPRTYVPLQLLSLSFALGTIGLVWMFLRRRVAPLIAALVPLLFAFHGGVVSHATMVMSETTYIFFTMLALVLLDRYEAEQSVFTWNWIGLALAAAMAYFVRVPGLTLIGGIFAYLLFRRQLGKAAAFGVPVAFALGLWFYRNWAVSGTLISEEYGRITVRSGLIGYLSQVQATVEGYFFIFPNSLIPLLSPKITHLLNALHPWLPFLLSLIIWGVVIAGCFYGIRHHFGAADIYVGLMGVLLVTWGYPQGRYLVPLVLFLYLYLVLGTSLISHWALSHIRTSIRPAHIVVLCVIGILLLNVARYVQGIANPVRQRIPDISLGATWIRDHSPTDAVIMVQVPRSTFIYAERASVPYPPDGNIPATDVDAYYFYDELPELTPGDALMQALETFDVDYLLIAPPLQTSTGPFVPQLDNYMRTVVLPTIKSYPDRFRLVCDHPSQQVFVYEVQRLDSH